MRKPIRTLLIGFAVSVSVSTTAFAEDAKPQLLRSPSLSRTHIAFCYAGDVWTVPREGGDATRLTAGALAEPGPIFSPDGTEIAFTAQYDGNPDVYVVPATGGTPRRVTYHPGPDLAVGWTRDGASILFASLRNSYSYFYRLFTFAARPGAAGFPAELPLPQATEASYSPDGKHLAYVPTNQWQRAWKRYRGGQTKRIWIADLADSSVLARIPRENSNDFDPMWVGNTIYFLSDRNGPVTLFAYDTGTKEVRQVVENRGLDIKAASAGPDAIVYEQFGSIHLVDLEGGRDKPVAIRVVGDFAEVRPHFQKIDPKRIRSAAISPTGARALFGVRGEVLTVPSEKGDIVNLTNTTDAAETDPAWSPDGKWIAYFSDESGEYALHLRGQSGMGEVRKIDLGRPASFYYAPAWSPDSRKIAYSDKRLNLWYVDVDKKTPQRVDTTTYAGPGQDFRPSWSGDSRWLAYARELRNHLHAIFIYSTEQAKTFQVTDGMSDALNPIFDREGKYLYFTASTDAALTPGWLDMSSLLHPVSRSVYIAVLRKEEPSPLAPENDQEKPEEAAKKDEKKDEKKPATAATNDQQKAGDKAADKSAATPPPPVQIDFERIGQRILALPIPARNYTQIAAGKPGVLFVVEGPVVDSLDFEGDGPTLVLHEFDLKTRKTEKILDEIGSFALSANGEKMLYRQKGQWFIRKAEKPEGPPKPGEGGPLKLDAMQVKVDPRAEWKHMYHQVWRGERDFFYDPGLHGLDLESITKRYEPYLENLASRSDLNYLFEEMLGELTVGHMFVGGGDQPETRKVKGGLLGADYEIADGRYRFARVYSGENWNPKLKAPLTQPGVDVRPGEYLLAVSGREIRSSDNLYSFFEETAGRAVTLKVGPKPDGSGAREVVVVPVEDETPLRTLAWVEGNRRKVDEMTGGRVAYTYLPDTYAGGFTNFNRYYFAQVGKDAAILDERFNGGGDIADYIIDYLRRPLLGFFTMREGEDITTPIEGIFGPKVMVINEMAGSGGDAMPWLFRRTKLGPLVGTRTWGGLVGHYTNPADLIDGGFVGTPDLAFYSPDGSWDVENHGVAPDIEVELDPKAFREGHDLQLEKAVAVVMDLLAKNPPPARKRPPYPNYHAGEKAVAAPVSSGQ
jgi:tricorn protease